MNDIKKAVAVLIVLLIVAAIIVVFQKRAPERPIAFDTALYSEFSSVIDKFVADSLTSAYEPSTGLEERSSEEATTVKETTTAKKSSETTEKITAVPVETTTEVWAEDYYDYHGGYIGYFKLTAYEWTGEPMANGEYPYYGAVACNSLALGTVIYIEGYGTFTVCDRGGMGNDVIDIYLGDPYECELFGIRYAEVYYD